MYGHDVPFNLSLDPLEGLWWRTSEVLWAEDGLPAELWSRRLVDDQIYSGAAESRKKVIIQHGNTRWKMTHTACARGNYVVIKSSQSNFQCLLIKINVLERSLGLKLSFYPPPQFFYKCIIPSIVNFEINLCTNASLCLWFSSVTQTHAYERTTSNQSEKSD